jgi:energy-coupling factor transporter ATP-binding protein EcfA2
MIAPELILMDEPFEGLSPMMVLHLEDIMQDLRGGGVVDSTGGAESVLGALGRRPDLCAGDGQDRAQVSRW